MRRPRRLLLLGSTLAATSSFFLVVLVRGLAWRVFLAVSLAIGLCMIVVASEQIFKRRKRPRRLPRPTLPLAANPDWRGQGTQGDFNSSEMYRRNGVDTESGQRPVQSNNATPQRRVFSDP
jgi:hypothetical protein